MGAAYSPQILLKRLTTGCQSGVDLSDVRVDGVVLEVPLLSDERRATAADGQKGAEDPPKHRAKVAQRRIRNDLARQVRVQIRHTFALVEEFRSSRERGYGSARLVVLLRAILQASQVTFSLATRLRGEDQRMKADRSRWLTDLELLLQLLLADKSPPAYDLAHATDALIVHLVQLMYEPRCGDLRTPEFSG